MHRSLDKIKCYDREAEQWHVVVETPRGGRHKYKYNAEMDAFTLHRTLPEGMAFPLDFGFLPHTRGADGDPLDVLVLVEDPTFTGCVIPCLLIGVIEAEQTEQDGTRERNDRLIAVPVDSRDLNDVNSIKDLDAKLLKDLECFFIFYNQIFGRRFQVKGVRGPRTAEKFAEAGIRSFQKHLK